MEVGAHVWLRKEDSHWGWVPAVVTKKEPIVLRGVDLINLTMKDDPNIEVTMPDQICRSTNSHLGRSGSTYFCDEDSFEVTVTVDPEQLKTADHDDIKLRNLPNSFHLAGEDQEAGVITSPGTHTDSSVVGGVDDLIELTHLHEPAILHALRLRYDANIIYTATGPILIAVNPFKKMDIYSADIMEKYCQQGENIAINNTTTSFNTPFKNRNKNLGENGSKRRLEPHVYQTADDAYRAMLRGMENQELMRNPRQRPSVVTAIHRASPANQSILVSGESGAGKTVTTKIVLNYFAMLSKRRSERAGNSPSSPDLLSNAEVSIEQQVLQSNPILESFGNARTIRNDNSSRFGKYIDIRFTRSGKLTGASIETYLLEKVRLIHPGPLERNYHVFYQFLSSASPEERQSYFIGQRHYQDFRMLSQSGTFDRRDKVSDVDNHKEMLEAMGTIGFNARTTADLMRLVSGVLFAGNMTFTSSKDGDSCRLNDTDDARACAALFGLSYEGLAAALTARVILAGDEIVHKPLTIEESVKASEALIKAVYGAAFDYIVEKVNNSITDDCSSVKLASIGLLDIFGFETFETNSFEQICINYTNEALQQQFNRYVFKLEQQEYEKEGILWKFISFPDNQDVLDLIDKKHTGVLALLDEQCILPKSTDEKFTRYLYARCDNHNRFSATSAQRVDYLFSIEHYAGYVEYNTDGWLEKNKDQLPAASADLLKSSDFDLIEKIQRFVRSEDRGGRGTVATKSVSSQFSSQLKILRSRIDDTVPHYVRCLKPNDELAPDYFEPKNVVEQLRCGGVLEAVRVSRAGYPTRYPHEVFLARYFILGDLKDSSPISPAFNLNDSSTTTELKRLISNLAYQLWYVDHQIIKAIVVAEQEGRDPFGSPKYLRRLGKAGQHNRKVKLQTGPFAPPINLVVESSMQSPEEQRKKRKDPTTHMRERRESTLHNVARPENDDEFLSLDFPSRCAIAGLQLGRTKVFLRREAFDRIEAMRSEKFFRSAAVIQAIVRGKYCRRHFLYLRAATIKAQSIMRMKLAANELAFLRVVCMVTKIQCAWRYYAAGKVVNDILLARRYAAIVVQRAFRNYRLARLGPTEDDILKAVTRFQALYRGSLSRKRLEFARIELRCFEAESMARERFEAERREEEARRNEIMAKKKVDPPMERAVTKVIANDQSSLETMHPSADHASLQALTVPGSHALVVSDSLLNELFHEIQCENWAAVESILDKNPELAEVPDAKTGELALHKIGRHNGVWTLLIDMVLVLYPKALIHKDNMGALPLHHAAAHDNLQALEIIYSAYKEGINEADKMGRLPLHVAANYDAVDAVKFLLAKSPEGAYTMVYRPLADSGGGLPLHIACANNASIGVITALLAENFASAKKADENGDLPLHLLLRCGEVVDPVVVKTLLTCFAGALSRTDSNGDLPLAISIKYECRSTVVNAILMQYPEAAGVLNGEQQSPLFLAFQHNADDRTIMGLLNHAPDLATAVDKKTGLLPIQAATENEHSHFIVHNLLKRDLPIDTKEKVRAQLIPHHYSWNHLVSNTEDLYHQVVTKVLQSCTQPQVLALAHVEGPDGRIALASATPVCKHEMRVMLRLFNTLEVVNQRPAYTNPISDTQIFYALRYDAPPQSNANYTVLHEEKKDGGDNDYLEEFDDHSHISALSRNSVRSTLTSRSQQTIEDKLRRIRNEKGQQVIAKLTSRSDVVERELKIRKDYHLSRHYVPAIISVHHTVQHAAYSEAMAEPGYCITMEGADTTAENLMLDMRKSGKRFPAKALKRIGISLLHMHEHGIIHGDFGTHNIGKFGNRWKLLGVGGSVPIGGSTDPDRGFYHPPESIFVENKRGSIGKKQSVASVVSIQADPTYDIWAYGVIVYESIAGVPLGPYACRGKRSMTPAEVYKIGIWDEHSVRKALKAIPEDDVSQDLLFRLLHPDPDVRLNSMRVVLEHPFFTVESLPKTRDSGIDSSSSPNTLTSSPSRNSRSQPRKNQNQNTSSTNANISRSSKSVPGLKAAGSMESIENRENNVRKTNHRLQQNDDPPSPSGGSVRSARSFGGFRKLRSSLRRVNDA